MIMVNENAPVEREQQADDCDHAGAEEKDEVIGNVLSENGAETS